MSWSPSPVVTIFSFGTIPKLSETEVRFPDIFIIWVIHFVSHNYDFDNWGHFITCPCPSVQTGPSLTFLVSFCLSVHVRLIVVGTGFRAISRTFVFFYTRIVKKI